MALTEFDSTATAAVDHRPLPPEPAPVSGAEAAERAVEALLPDAGGLCGLDVADYLLGRGWNHRGLVTGTHDVTAWTRTHHGEHQELSVALDPHRAGAAVLLRYSIARLAGYEDRPAAVVLAALRTAETRTPARPPGGYPHLGAVLEVRMRHDYTRFHRLLTTDGSVGAVREAGDLERRWRRMHLDDCGHRWRELHTVVTAWAEAPLVAGGLYAVLQRHQHGVDPVILRHHDQARGLTQTATPSPAACPAPGNR